MKEQVQHTHNFFRTLFGWKPKDPILLFKSSDGVSWLPADFWKTLKEDNIKIR